jgi:hypothetical protein
MKRRLKWALLLLSAFLPLVVLGWFVQTFREKLAVAQISDALKTRIDLKDFQQRPLTFTKALQLIEEQCASKGKRLPIHVDYPAFLEDADVHVLFKAFGGPGLLDFEIKFPRHPKKMSAGTALRLVLCKMSPPVAKYGATYEIQPNGVIITPLSKEQQQVVLRVYPFTGLVIPQVENTQKNLP